MAASEMTASGGTSADPMGIYDASDDERKVAKEDRKQGESEEQEQEQDESEEDDIEENQEEPDDQPRICTICFNLKLFVEPITNPLATFQTSSQQVLYEEVMRDSIKSKCMVKIEFYELLESTRLGYCAYCQFIFDCLRTEDAEPDESKSTIIRIIARKGYPFYIYWDDKNKGPRGVEAYAEKGTIPCVPELGFATELAPRAFADHAFSQIREWLQDCESNHPGCPRISLTPPRRLIDVGIPTPPSGARIVKLVQDRMEPVKYIALSHCWGTEQNFTTTKATRDARMKEIAWNELPKTYRDAIKVARKLHIRYVWIDSLCIIQDDADDWDVESAKMAMIYEESYLTLAASLSSGDSHGFLGLDDNRLLYASQPVKGVNTTRIRKIHDYRTLPSEDVLGTRAWTMQERIIPQRLLTFSLGISFQCRQADWCECGSSLFPDLLSADSDTWRRLDRAICRASLETEDNPSELYHFWLNGIVVPYSNKKLTKMSDRLPAVSALAQKFQLKLDEKYLAGLWEKDLICGLSWASDISKTEEDHRDMSDRAPSWSWASVEGPVKFGFINEAYNRPRNPNLRLRFTTYTINPRGFNFTGEVESGSLNAIGPCLHCFLTLEGQEKDASYQLIPLLQKLENAVVSGRLSTNQLQLDTGLEEVEINETDGSTTNSLNRCKYDNKDPVGGIVSCLLLYQLQQDAIFIREFLVLGRNPSAFGTYQRLGILRLSSWDSALWKLWFGELPEFSFNIT